MLKEYNCNSLNELLKLMIKQSAKNKEEFDKKPKREQLEIKLDRATKDYNACFMVGNYEGIQACRADINSFSEQLELLDKEEQ